MHSVSFSIVEGVVLGTHQAWGWVCMRSKLTPAPIISSWISLCLSRVLQRRPTQSFSDRNNHLCIIHLRHRSKIFSKKMIIDSNKKLNRNQWHNLLTKISRWSIRKIWYTLWTKYLRRSIIRSKSRSCARSEKRSQTTTCKAIWILELKHRRGFLKL